MDPFAYFTSLSGELAPLLTKLRSLSPGVTLAVGLVALVSGGTAWRGLRIVAGLGLGGWAGFYLGQFVSDPRVTVAMVLLLGVGLAVLFYMVERVAIATLGGAVGAALVRLGWPIVYPGQVASALWLTVGGLGGTLLAGFFHQPAVKGLTACLGAALIAYAVGQERLVVIAPLAAVGWAWQLWGRLPAGGSKSPMKKKKK